MIKCVDNNTKSVKTNNSALNTKHSENTEILKHTRTQDTSSFMNEQLSDDLNGIKNIVK